MCWLRDFCMYCCQCDGDIASKAYDSMGRRIPRNESESSFSYRKKSEDGQQEHIIQPMDSSRHDDIAVSIPDIGRRNQRAVTEQQNNDQRLNTIAVSGVKTAARMNVQKKYLKDVLRRLVSRYKIKNLTKK